MAILWVIVGVLALSFFGISLEKLVSDPTTQANFIYLWHLVTLGISALAAYFADLTLPFK